MLRFLSILAAAAVVCLLLVTWIASLGVWPFADRSGDQFASCRSSAVAGGVGQIGGPFSLLDSGGKTVTDADVITAPSLVYFGYTFCPDVCPMDTIRNAEAVDVLEENGKITTPVFISIDPKRDTPEVVGDYAEAIHPRMIGLTGTADQVKAASRAYRTYYKAHDGDDEYYLVDHSTMTYLVLPEHGVVEFFRRDVGPEALAAKAACFIDKS
ncbi:SCO family protein [Rhodobacteraceae bacterium]|jgi:protein SCO1/2|nr:SCO family protein [Marinovum sp.]MDA8740992.1 SCO family protein [Paracoccaceae bacterium]MDG2294679.1 SCO family protein [Paracoccaceae bacterium]|tara:strand:+ start:1476 stop:2111 length:636 start_codon:yes stop_codon:yes gene_type:complete